MDLTQAQWATKLDEDSDAVILDVRTPEEWEEGVIESAHLLDIYDSQKFLEELRSMDTSKNFYVYCKAGGRSGQACQIMNQMGFANTFNLQGGVMQWTGDLVSP